MKKMLRFVKKLIRKEVPELPKGYVRQNKIYGFEVARSNSGQICWIPSGKLTRDILSRASGKNWMDSM